MSDFRIRRACEQDGAELARLAAQLGYPVSDDAMQKRLQRLLVSDSDVVYVAEAAGGGLVGWIHGLLSQFLESDYRLEIAGLVVDERFHRKGVGRALVAPVETWAAAHGVEQAVVRCQSKRAEAHQFYRSLGYSQTKTQIVFRRSLTGRTGFTPAK